MFLDSIIAGFSVLAYSHRKNSDMMIVGNDLNVLANHVLYIKGEELLN